MFDAVVREKLMELLPAALAQTVGAKCLDGSNAGYWIQKTANASHARAMRLSREKSPLKTAGRRMKKTICQPCQQVFPGIINLYYMPSMPATCRRMAVLLSASTSSTSTCSGSCSTVWLTVCCTTSVFV